MNKTISINPDLFRVSGRSKKNRDKDDKGKIKVRSQSQLKEKTKTFRKKHVLKFIRDQQHKNMQQMLNPEPVQDKSQPSDNTFSSDFEESLKFMNDLSTQPKNKNNHNHTLRSNTGNVPVAESLLFHSSIPISEYENVNLEMPTEFISHPPIIRQSPNWGCLKNGSLPTYRNWRNTTQRNASAVLSKPTLAPMNMPIPIQMIMPNHAPTSLLPSAQILNNTQDNSVSGGEKLQIMQKMVEKQQQQQVANPVKMYYPKQKRTVKRSYRVGKSKTKPTVTVLVSNKTIRNNTTTKTQLLKQAPIEEVRRNLMKKGFIKVGSSAPNDVLRKIYETTSLICGEVQNHNPDNLMYNFFNDLKGTNGSL